MIAAVVFAMPAEFAPWRRRHAFQPIVATGLSVFEAQVGPTRARVMTSGIGAPNAATLVKAIHAGGADVIVVAGVGGGLSHSMQPARSLPRDGSGPSTVAATQS